MSEHDIPGDTIMSSEQQTEEGQAPEAELVALEHNQAAPTETSNTTKPKRKPKEPATFEREPGKSLFPVSRVQRILKADKELPMVSREAVLLISLATEEFVKRISEASHRLAHRENRMTVQRKDIASVCRRAEEFLFLEELIPLYDPEAATRRKPKALQPKDTNDESRPKTMLDQFVSRPKPTDPVEPPENATADEDFVMNEDGTMTI